MKKQVAKLVAGLTVAALAALSLPTTSGAAVTLRIWADANRKAAVEKVAGAWGKKNGVTVTVVQKDFGAIRDDLKTVDAATAPDVIVGAHDWVGGLAANGSIVPLTVSTARTRAILPTALQGFTAANAKGEGRLFGTPTQIENVALIVNTSLAKVPTSFDDLVKQALAFQNKASGNIGLAVPGGDTYHYYPFLSGLCGYIFGRDAKGQLNPKDIGVLNSKFIANAAQIDAWNVSGFLSSKVDYGIAKNAFLAGKSPFWITGPWESKTIADSGLKYRIVQVPRNKCDSVPFFGAQGFMVTKFAKVHRVESQARDLVGNHMMSLNAQLQLANANDRLPAHTAAAARVKNPVLTAFAAAGKGAVPMPNIPAMDSVWGDMGNAWTNTLKGGSSSGALATFRTAGKNIAAKIG